eukprot:12080961-Prorocentrum_lima.AAC.1
MWKEHFNDVVDDSKDDCSTDVYMHMTNQLGGQPGIDSWQNEWMGWISEQWEDVSEDPLLP